MGYHSSSSSRDHHRGHHRHRREVSEHDRERGHKGSSKRRRSRSRSPPSSYHFSSSSRREHYDDHRHKKRRGHREDRSPTRHERGHWSERARRDGHDPRDSRPPTGTRVTGYYSHNQNDSQRPLRGEPSPERERRHLESTTATKTTPARRRSDVGAHTSPQPAAAIATPAGSQAPDDETLAMRAMMGLTGFSSTKGQTVVGNDSGAVAVRKQRQYRQYMNRKGGFNRPLSPKR